MPEGSQSNKSREYKQIRENEEQDKAPTRPESMLIEKGFSTSYAPTRLLRTDRGAFHLLIAKLLIFGVLQAALPHGMIAVSGRE